MDMSLTTMLAIVHGLGRLGMLGLMLALAACTSQSRKTATHLDVSHERFSSRECQISQARAQLHDNIKLSRVVASPVAVLLSGGALFLPLLAVNAGLDAADHLDASDISVDCGGPETPNTEIAKEVLMGVGFGASVGK